MGTWQHHRKAADEWEECARRGSSHEVQMEALALAQLEMLKALFELTKASPERHQVRL